MEAIKIQQTEPSLMAQALRRQRIRGLDYDKDGNVINLLTHEDVIERADRRMMAHYGEVSRQIINERRARNGEKLL
jgi:hypothetical protein